MDISIQGTDSIIADFTAYPGNIGKAIVRAMRRAVTSGRAAIAPDVAADMGLKVRDARDAIKTSVMDAGDTIEGRISASLTRLPLSRFGARQTRAGVTYRIGSQGRKTLPHAFLARMKSGHEGVFMRKGPPRLPIQEKFGPSIGHVFMKHKAAGLTAAAESFEKNMTHELERLEKATVSVAETAGA